MPEQDSAGTPLHRGVRDAWLRTTFQQRLDWLWQAKLFAARALRAAHERRAARAAAASSTTDPARSLPRS
jgi:hypothetical protein